MPVATRSEPMLEQPTGLLASPRDGEGNFLRRVVQSRQGNVVIVAHEKVGNLSPPCATAKDLPDVE